MGATTETALPYYKRIPVFICFFFSSVDFFSLSEILLAERWRLQSHTAEDCAWFFGNTSSNYLDPCLFIWAMLLHSCTTKGCVWVYANTPNNFGSSCLLFWKMELYYKRLSTIICNFFSSYLSSCFLSDWWSCTIDDCLWFCGNTSSVYPCFCISVSTMELHSHTIKAAYDFMGIHPTDNWAPVCWSERWSCFPIQYIVGLPPAVMRSFW